MTATRRLVGFAGRLAVAMFVAVGALRFGVVSAQAQGALTPPLGAPAPTQRSLAEIDNRLGALDTVTQALAAGVQAVRFEQRQVLAMLRPEFLPWQVRALRPLMQTLAYRTLPPTLAVDREGRIWVAHVSGGTAWVSHGTDGSWVHESLGVPARRCAIALLPDGVPVVLAAGPDGWLRLLRRQGEIWSWQPLPDFGSESMVSMERGPELVIGPAGDYTVVVAQGPELRAIRSSDGVNWETPALLSGVFGEGLSVALDRTGQPAVLFSTWQDSGGVGSSLRLLKLARWAGASWSSSTITADVRSGALAFDPENRAAVAYQDSSGLVFVDPVTGPALIVGGSYFIYASISFGPEREPRIAVFDAARGEVAFLLRRAGAWLRQPVAPVTQAWIAPALAWGPDFLPVLAYVDDPALTLYCAGVLRAP